jgi:hypothetical protein
MRIRKAFGCALLLAVSTLLFGCAREVRLYPTNSAASAIGLIKVNYVDNGLGYGKLEADLPDGEHLTGEYSTQDNSVYGFGSIIALGGSSSLSAVSMGGSQRGIASLVGNRGTTMQCEYFANVMTSSGAGVCKTNKGAVFQLHF